MDFGDLQQLQDGYRSEAADLLADLGDALLLLENDSHNGELINRVFRAMHTLKGSGASAGFRRLANFVHHVEEVFNRIRNKQLETSPELIDATLKACDCCASLMKLSADDMDTPVPLVDEVLTAIKPFLPEASKSADTKKSGGKLQAIGAGRYNIGFRPNREIFFSGTDPATLLYELADLGTMKVRCDTAELLETEEFDPERCYLQWKVSIESDKPEDLVRAVFQFVEDDCDLTIAREAVAPTAAVADKGARFVGAARQFLLAIGFALDQCESGDPIQEKQGLGNARRTAQTLIGVAKAHGHAPAVKAAKALLDEIVLARQGAVLDSDWLKMMRTLTEAAGVAAEGPAIAPVAAAVATAKSTETVGGGEASPGTAAPSIRVDSAKLDALMRLAGELLVARGALPAFAERFERKSKGRDPDSLEDIANIANIAKEMRDAGNKLSRLADDLQATVMSIRMLPVRQVFQRFPRLVRDLARTLDKEIELRVSGEETELDKTVIDSLGDPLTHIIRNAADHGIESKAERALKGKAAIGHISLSAFTRGSNVVIEIRDDGKGLDPEKLKRRALEKGLYTEAALAAMDDEAAYAIILAAGFSTIDKVTDLSGRGVGMDVVRTCVEELRGAIIIESKIGKGTCFRIELPASLLVSKGILAAIAGQQVVLPMQTIRNMVKVPPSTLRTVNGQRIASLRGSVFPILPLAEALSFGWDDHPHGENGEDDAEIAIAIIEATAGSYGLIVDRFVGEVEVVVKPLTGVLAQVPEYVGAAIMGDGKTVLVVNTEKLFALQRTSRPSRTTRPLQDTATLHMVSS